MKKQSLLLIGSTLLAFASCQPDASTDGMYTQEQVDSIVDARVMEQMIVLQNNNDSVINVLAQMKADSMIAELKAGKPVTTKTTTTRTTTVNNGGSTQPEPTEPSISDRKSSEDNKSNTSISDRKSSEDSKSNTSISNRKSKQP